MTAILVCRLLETKQEQELGRRFQKKMENAGSGAGKTSAAACTLQPR